MVALCGFLALAVAGQIVSQTDALAMAFPGASLTRHEHLINPSQMAQLQQRAGTGLRKPFVVAYEARKNQDLIGVAFFDTHIVRTQIETAMVAISPQGTIVRVELVAFKEPQEYQAPTQWVSQLKGKSLDPRLSLKGDIRPLSGASLTAGALTDASRRALALWEILYKRNR